MKKRSKFWRFLEIVPGALAWLAIIWPVVFSFIWPSAVAVYILVYDLFWVCRAFYMTSLLVRTSRKMKEARRIDFKAKLDNLPSDDPLVADWRPLYQVVIFATFREEIETLLPSVESVVKANWPNQKKIIMLAGEQRDRERLRRVFGELKARFDDKIFDFLVSEHPDGIEGEVKGKGAGSAWAGRKLSKYFEKQGLNEEEAIIYIADADTRFDEDFFNAVAFEFAVNPNRHRRTYQPIPLFSNNIWHTHTIARLTAWGSSFWQMMQASRPWRMTNFSTHAYSLKMLREMDYWAVDVVNEDSRQFWRAYFAFDGDHKVVPIYLPVHMDAVIADDFLTTVKNQYLQKRRWAYGIEHFPYIVTKSIKNKKIPFWDKWGKTLILLDDTVSWSTASYYLTVVGLLPIIFSSAFRDTVLAYNFPLIAKVLLSLTWIGLAISAYTSLSYLPPKPKGFPRTKYLEFAAEWIITPISAILFGSIPALVSQSRLMLGKYLTFWVTPKTTAARK
ncbi:MAG: glycosyltransferase family 2 protein [Candidatus Berkelbacteria bacterium]|nr:glycosyltransferase family 2 protein [Candidatus Berkelbacteria bacterium]